MNSRPKFPFNNRNTKVSLIVAVSVVLLASACASSSQSLILGKWEVENSPMKMTAEFHRDGTANITMLGQTVQGKYQLNDGELVWTMNGITTKAKANVTVAELELTNDQNQTIKYKRR